MTCDLQAGFINSGGIVKKNSWFARLGLGVLVVLLAACSAPPSAAPTATAVLAVPTDVPPTATSVPASPTPVNTPTEVAVVDYCVACHTDKDQLISTAKPEEKKEKESEGAG
jgi:hypothetical protein